MKKSKGKIIMEFYDKYGHKVKTEEAPNFIECKRMANNWESEKEGNSAIGSRVLYNTHSNNDKWSYEK